MWHQSDVGVFDQHLENYENVDKVGGGIGVNFRYVRTQMLHVIETLVQAFPQCLKITQNVAFEFLNLGILIISCPLKSKSCSLCSQFRIRLFQTPFRSVMFFARDTCKSSIFFAKFFVIFCLRNDLCSCYCSQVEESNLTRFWRKKHSSWLS